MTKLILILFLYSKSPVLSAWLSFLFPGGGQFYTKNYIKGALIGATEIYLIHEFKRIYDLRKEERIPDTTYERKILYNGIIYLMVHIYSIADAYVSAHFYNFPKDTTLNLSFLIDKESFKFFLKKKF
ncbi:MAG: hypothetical protein ABIM60_00075 [candidate division WOR-3 bacterium]